MSKPTKFLNEAINKTDLINKALMYFEIFMHNQQNRSIYGREHMTIDALNTLNSLIAQGLLKSSYTHSALEDNPIIKKAVMSDNFSANLDEEDTVEEFAWDFYDNQPEDSKLGQIINLYHKLYNNIDESLTIEEKKRWIELW